MEMRCENQRSDYSDEALAVCVKKDQLGTGNKCAVRSEYMRICKKLVKEVR